MTRLTFSLATLFYWQTVRDTLVICCSPDGTDISHLGCPSETLNLSHLNIQCSGCQSYSGQLSWPLVCVIQPVLIYTNLDPIFGPLALELSLYLSVGSSQQISPDSSLSLVPCHTTWGRTPAYNPYSPCLPPLSFTCCLV